MNENQKIEEREDGTYIWIDPDSLPPMLQDSAGGWHRINGTGNNQKEKK